MHITSGRGSFSAEGDQTCITIVRTGLVQYAGRLARLATESEGNTVPTQVGGRNSWCFRLQARAGFFGAVYRIVGRSWQDVEVMVDDLHAYILRTVRVCTSRGHLAHSVLINQRQPRCFFFICMRHRKQASTVISHSRERGPRRGRG
jgi:hypothetical protein